MQELAKEFNRCDIWLLFCSHINYCSQWQNWQVGCFKHAVAKLYQAHNLSDHGDKQETWTIKTVCKEREV